MHRGHLVIVLHAHLPYIRHPEHERFLEEDWLFEAISETYIPLITMLENVSRYGIRNVLTLSLSPPLIEMLSDHFLMNRYTGHLERLIVVAEREAQDRQDTPYSMVAVLYRDHLRHCLRTVRDVWGGNILNAFRHLWQAGVIELITCAGTHPVLPLCQTQETRRAHLRIASRAFQHHLGSETRGMWLPECAFEPAEEGWPGIDELLNELGIRFSFIETHGLMYGRPRPKFGIYRPVYTSTGVAFFGRDVETSHQVWSREHGYPGDGDYREFYRDLGYDGDYERVKPALHLDGVRRNIGLKYHRISGHGVSLGDKAPYNPNAAREKAAMHAGDFVGNRIRQTEYLADLLKTEPVVTAMYDAELFGHWWFEGIWFLEYVIKKMHFDQNIVSVTTPSAFLAGNPVHQVIEPAASTWGYKGYLETWVNGRTEWILKHSHAAEARMVELARRFPHEEGLRRRALDQAARELMLLQASDWPFLISTGTAAEYSAKRVSDHTTAFNRLHDQILSNNIDEAYLASLENRNAIFRDEMDYHLFA